MAGVTTPDWPTPEQIRTHRLTLEPLAVEHADDMVDVLAAQEMYAFTGGTPPTRDELVRRYQGQATGRSPDGTQGWLNWVLRLHNSGALAGTVQATVERRDTEVVAAIAWVVAQREQGRGYAGEAATAMAAWLRAHGVTTLTASIHPDHLASHAVARRVGLAPTGEVDDNDGEELWRAT